MKNSHGGSRPHAGRPTAGTVQYTTRLPADRITYLNKLARKANRPTCSILADLIDAHALNLGTRLPTPTKRRARKARHAVSLPKDAQPPTPTPQNASCAKPDLPKDAPETVSYPGKDMSTHYLIDIRAAKQAAYQKTLT